MTELSARVEAVRDLLADLDVFAPRLWEEAPSYRFAARWDTDALTAAEQRLGVSLPADYRAFLTVVGISGPGPDYGLAGPDNWAMPAELPTDSVTVTTVHGDTFIAGTGERPGLLGIPSPARPFPLAQAWHPGDEVPAIPAGGHFYDGCLHLNDIGCGYSSFLVVTGPQRGTVWVDYSAGDGDIAPVAPFLDWYESWLDRCVTSLLGPAVRDALSAAMVSPFDRYLHRWAACFERHDSPMDRAELAALRLYQGRRAEALTLINALADLELSYLDDALGHLTEWYDPAGARAATADPPEPTAAVSPLWRIRLLLARNPAAPPHLLAGLVDDDRTEVRQAVAAHPNCPPAALAVLAERAERQWTSTSRLSCLYELDLVARHPLAPPNTVESLSSLAERVDDVLATAVVRAVAGNPATPTDILNRLAAAPWPWVRAAVAGHPATPAPVFDVLGQDTHPAVRAAVAARPDTAVLLADLARDPVSAVRAAVAANPAADPSTLRRLGTDQDNDVFYSLARNPARPDDVATVLANHPYNPLPTDAGPGFDDSVLRPTSVVAVVAAGEVDAVDYPYGLLATAIADPDPMVGYRAGTSPWLDDDLLRALSHHPYAYARIRVADHHTPPVDALIDLVADPVPMVARPAAARPEVPLDVVLPLMDDPDDERRWGVADHPALPVEALRRLAADPSIYVRRAVLGNPGTSADVVGDLLRDPEPLVRAAAARRSDLSEAAVNTLLDDENDVVRKAGRWVQGRLRLERETTP